MGQLVGLTPCSTNAPMRGSFSVVASMAARRLAFTLGVIGNAVGLPPKTKESAVHLEGSCHCGKVKFTVESTEPVPFMRCYCSICRKTAGAGGYAINLGAAARSLRVTGKRYLRIYQIWLPTNYSWVKI